MKLNRSNRLRPFAGTGLAVFVLAILASLAGSAAAQGLIVERAPEPPADETPRQPVRNFGISVKSHLVEVSIKDQVATTKVTEVFHNPTAQQLEATFFFPLPEEASINQFAMTMNGQMVEGEVLPADQARGIYEGIVRRQKDPGLLEYVGRKLFRARIFPVTPNGDTTVVMTYTELLNGENGLVRYQYPLDTSKFTDLKTSEVVVRVDIESQQPLRTVYSPSHDVDLTRRGENVAVAGFEGKDLVTNNDFLLYYTLDSADVGLSLLTYKDGGEDGYFMLIASPKQNYSADEIQPKDIVFVVDTSGSMNTDNKMTQAKNALTYCLSNLNPNDRFNIVPFSTVARTYKDELVSVNDENVAAANKYVSELRATGGTAIDDALKQALAQVTKAERDGRVGMVVFMTDGLPTVGERNIANILKNAGESNPENVRVFTFGVGNNVNTHLLDKLAESTRGAREYIAPQEDIEAKVSGFYEKVSSPVLANLKLDLGDVETYDIFPRQLPDLFKGSQLVIFGRYRGAGGPTKVALNGQVSGNARTYDWEGQFATDNISDDFLPRLWAIRKVGFMMDEIRLHGYSDELKNEIVRLGTRFGIVTPYTSFLVVEDSELQNMPQPGPRTDRGRWNREGAGDGAPRRDFGHGGGRGGAPTGRPGTPPVNDPNASPEPQPEAEPEAPAESPDDLALGADSDNGATSESSSELREAEERLRNMARDERQQQGQDAIRDSLQAEKMKDAESLDKALAGSAGEAARKAIQDKTFVHRQGWWIDTMFNPETHKGDKRVEVESFSDEYFALLRKHPRLARYASAGDRCVVVFEGVAYVIKPAAEESGDDASDGNDGSND